MISVTDAGPVRWLTIDNPGTRNAVTQEGWWRLAEELTAFGESDQRALVLIGSGDDFCSGADLGGDIAELAAPVARYGWMRRVGEAAGALHGLTKPTLAAVDGVAVGAGMNLALGCDIVIASDQARFSEIFVRRGLTVDFGGSWLLPRIVGLARAKEIALTGRMVGAEEALSLGLVARVVPAGDLREAAEEVASQLAAGAPIAQRFIKMGLDRSAGMSFEEALEYESQAQTLCLASEDVIEGVTAFIQKRDPEFKGR